MQLKKANQKAAAEEAALRAAEETAKEAEKTVAEFKTSEEAVAKELAALKAQQ